MTMRSWINGVAEEQVPANDRGLLYGDGVFRTLLIWDGALIWRDEQLAKLRNDAQVLGLGVHAQQIEDDLALAVACAPRAVLRYCITAGDGERGYARTGAAARRVMLLSDLPQWPAANWHHGIAVESSDVTLSAQPALSGVKHLNRLDQVLARQRLSTNATEALMADGIAQVTCAIAGNVFWSDGEAWRTPEIAGAGVAGVARDQLLATFSRLGLACRIESSLKLGEFGTVQAMLICNSLIGVWPVASLDGRPLETTVNRAWMAIRQSFPHPWLGAFDAQQARASS